MPPGVVPAKAASIDVRAGEVMNAPERKDLATVLEADSNEASEHLSTVEVGPGNQGE